MVVLNKSFFTGKVMYGEPFEGFRPVSDTDRRVREFFEGKTADKPPQSSRSRGDLIEFAVLQDTSSVDLKLADIVAAIKQESLRPCCFWELAWAVHSSQNLPEVSYDLDRLTALLNPLPHGMIGEGRRFVYFSGKGKDVFTPNFQIVSETVVGNKRRPFKFLAVSNTIPEPITRAFLRQAS